jgi:hypothetical protein
VILRRGCYSGGPNPIGFAIFLVVKSFNLPLLLWERGSPSTFTTVELSIEHFLALSDGEEFQSAFILVAKRVIILMGDLGFPSVLWERGSPSTFTTVELSIQHFLALSDGEDFQSAFILVAKRVIILIGILVSQVSRRRERDQCQGDVP